MDSIFLHGSIMLLKDSGDMTAAQLTVVGCALAFYANPPFLRDGLIYHPQQWYTIAQKGNQGTKDRFACMELQPSRSGKLPSL